VTVDHHACILTESISFLFGSLDHLEYLFSLLAMMRMGLAC